MKTVVADAVAYQWKCAHLILPGGEKLIIATDGDIIRVRGMGVQPLEMRPKRCVDKIEPIPEYQMWRGW